MGERLVPLALVYLLVLRAPWEIRMPPLVLLVHLLEVYLEHQKHHRRPLIPAVACSVLLPNLLRGFRPLLGLRRKQVELLVLEARQQPLAQARPLEVQVLEAELSAAQLQGLVLEALAALGVVEVVQDLEVLLLLLVEALEVLPPAVPSGVLVVALEAASVAIPQAASLVLLGLLVEVIVLVVLVQM